MMVNNNQEMHQRSVPAWRQGLALLLLCGALAEVMSSAAFAQPVSGSFDGFKVAQDAPIQIDADTLVVSRKARTATFTGRVVAVRDTMRLAAKSLIITYQSVAQGTGKSRTEITRLDAKGGVKVTNRNQSAQGDWAVMNVRTSKITLGGNVVLRQDDTVIRGARLYIDLKTGRSRLVGGGGRVHGVFTPAKK